MSRPRPAFTILEVTSAVVLLAAVLMGVAHVLAVVAGQQREAERRRLATQEAANVMERMMAQPWQELSSETAAAVTLSQSARQALPDARLNVDVVDEDVVQENVEEEGVVDDDPQPKSWRIEVEIQWRNQSGQRGQPIRLTAWKYRLESQQP